MELDTSKLLHAMDIAVFTHSKDNTFTLSTPPSEWLTKLLPDIETVPTVDLVESFPFLSLFIEDIQAHWRSGSSKVVASDEWVESISDEGGMPLQAKATTQGSQNLLILESIGTRYQDTQRIYQAARDILLTREELEQQVAERTSEIRRREEEISMRLLSATNMRDQETGEHVRRIGLYSAAIAKALGWNSLDVQDILVAAPMHDIGKIGIPDHILLKPGKLSVAEFRIMQTHAQIGADVLSGSDIPLLEMAQKIALSHHERWDGTGYPHQIAGANIPQCARIVTVCDVYDALTHKRVYKRAFSVNETITMMQVESGQHFDSTILECFLDILPTIHHIRETISESVDEVRNFEQLTGTFG